MDGSTRRSWVPVALLAAVAYLAVGRLFAVPATHVRAWRLAAWLVSGAVFAAHIAFEHFRLRSSPRAAALHAALAVGAGAAGLAAAGVIHSLAAGTPLRLTWLLAFAVWPAVTGVPAFLAALAAAALLSRLTRSTDPT